MTEQQWLSCEDPSKLMAVLWDDDRSTERKFGLFAAACCRRVWPLLTGVGLRHAVELAERFADGAADAEELAKARMQLPRLWAGGTAAKEVASEAAATTLTRLGPGLALFVARAVARAVWVGAKTGAVARWDDEGAWQCDALRDLFGPLSGRPRPPDAAWLEWDRGVVIRLARAAYEVRLLPSGELDHARLAVLADALEDAGCTDDVLLSHLRSATPHLRGCWAIDLLLGKERRSA